ncbi:MAG: ABC transporter ATP-binding protein [Acidobacteria bacterium]|nr:ABC transporter ATP-binding protein [Acidobacteriota bacterium]
MRDLLNASLWPADSAAQLVESLAHRAGMPVQAPSGGSAAGLTQTIAALGLEAEPVRLVPADLDRALREAPPAVLPLPGGLLALAALRGRRIGLLGPDLRLRYVPGEVISDFACAEAEAPHAGEVNDLLQVCGITPSRRAAARRALLRERLGTVPLGELVQLRTPPGSSFPAQLREGRLLARLAAYAGVHALEYLLLLLAWWVLGEGALSGRTDHGWLWAWTLLLLSMAPLRMWMLWLQGWLAIGVGGMLKQRLLAGALALDPDCLRRQGSGQLLGRVVEAETVESLALGGGFGALAATVELVLAACVLLAGAGGVPLAVLLAGFVAATAGLGLAFARRRRTWTAARLALTEDLVEGMAGHRTRLAQQAPEAWHEGEDRSLADYLHQAGVMDRRAVVLAALASRGWLVAGLAGLVPTFLSGGGGGSTAALAVSLGGVLLAHRALRRLAASITQLAGAAIAWEAVRPMFSAAGVLPAPPIPEDAPAAVLLDAQDLAYAHAGGRPVLRGASLRILSGDRLLLEGESGGGKSTLAAVLVGLREPSSGLLLAGGLDRRTLGPGGWRRRVVAAPQYHENHILCASLAFNLLMGRAWPPRQADLDEAWYVCQELGLGPLLQRMPAGIFQSVGDTGWQLSQGERSRVFIARALLQGAGLVVLDESFAALDPENLRRAMDCVLKRSPALLVVAHP